MEAKCLVKKNGRFYEATCFFEFINELPSSIVIGKQISGNLDGYRRMDGYCSINQYIRKTFKLNTKDAGEKEDDFFKKHAIERFYFISSTIIGKKKDRINKDEQNESDISRNILNYDPNRDMIRLIMNHDDTYWDHYNPLCEKCTHECKQSHLVSIIQCKMYEKTSNYNKK